MTQIARYAQFMKVVIKSVKASIKLNLTLTGSVLAQTVDAGAKSVEVNYQIESDEDSEKIKAVLRNARNGCWARQMVAKPIPFDDTLVLNGKSIKLSL